ncbi:hypothetical protein RB614_30660 [Phytohabitans sp. ZYX-F-186]|uniref:3-methyl-2-oxobutanoate hydroxymethyltransferase n=1 Tax=Phytohabitans maris TaxID=3071409 RepID=A0ABU0ZQ73_9ACTN|nr:hypothetical protein [Phytohabitans sp. ZYX-F-186]MDQ7908901.1 hypothetical protein [Phytohabitans sp. ZYX-F-186]
MRPVLLNSCARAATAAEARFRIDAPIVPSRGARVFALDGPAEEIVRRIAARPWATARFFGHAGDGRVRPLVGVSTVDISAELDGADVAVLVATSPDGARAAAAVGEHCRARGTMTAGLVVDGGAGALDAVAMLRPYARVLLLTGDEDDIAAVLTALRA